jgi:putative PIG3 family NAD(P)H quinone oxidoreductase
VRAIIVTEPGGPEVLQLQEVETPEVGPDEILIKVAAAGINRADVLQRQGNYPPPPGASGVLGLEVSGTVAAVGANVHSWQDGDACVALLAGGGYAEYVAVPVGQVVPPPPGLDLVTAGGVLEVAATVDSNFEMARLNSGEVFLVHGGAGGIGAFAIQYAKARGATVISTAGTHEKIDFCRSLGADHALSYREDWPAAISEITRGRGVDVILDNMGASYLTDHLRVLASNGRLMIIGMQGGSKASFDISALLRRRGSITATSLRARPAEEKTAICRGVLERVWPLYGNGMIKPPRISRFPVADAAAGHAQLESGDNIGKIILTVDAAA